MNRHLLLCLIAIALLVTVGCPPRHPPHTPQPFGAHKLTLPSPDTGNVLFALFINPTQTSLSDPRDTW